MCRSRAGLVRASPGSWTLPSLRSQNGAGSPSLQYRAPHASASQFSVLATLSPGSQPPEVLASVACVGGPWSRHPSSRLRSWPGPLGPRRLRSPFLRPRPFRSICGLGCSRNCPPRSFPANTAVGRPTPSPLSAPGWERRQPPAAGGVCVGG